MENEILTIEEVAAYLRVSERTVYDWAQKGEIPCGRLGTVWRFKRSEIENWVSRKLTPRVSAYQDTQLSLSHIVSPDRSKILTSCTKYDALGELIDLCVSIPGIKSRNQLAESIFEREQLMSTGIGLGVGVPHVRLLQVTDIFAAVGVTKEPIRDYEALDNEPVSIIFMIIAGRDQHTAYIKVLSQISRLLKNQQIRNTLLSATTPEQICKIFTHGQEL